MDRASKFSSMYGTGGWRYPRREMPSPTPKQRKPNQPKHLYEGTDSEEDDDEYITSGRAAIDARKREKALAKNAETPAPTQKQLNSTYEALSNQYVVGGNKEVTAGPQIPYSTKPQVPVSAKQSELPDEGYSAPDSKEPKSGQMSNPNTEPAVFGGEAVPVKYRKPYGPTGWNSSLLTPARYLSPYAQVRLGELVDKDEEFISFQLLKKYPYLYVGKANQQKVSEGFFEEGKVYYHPWDFFYIYRLKSDPNTQPIILVPTKQFEEFLEKINEALDIRLRIPTGGSSTALAIAFSDPNLPRPRYLGCVVSQAEAETSKQNVPPAYFRIPGEKPPGTPSASSIADFQRKIDLIHNAQKKPKSKNSSKSSQDRLAKFMAWGQCIRQVQRLLSLIDSEPGENAIPDDITFASIDIEAYERNQNIITEIGIATLDTKSIRGKNPGEKGTEWASFIRARHFRIQENMQYNNHEFVRGCAENFEYGTSEVIKLADAPKVVTSCLEEPFFNPEDTKVDDENRPPRYVVIVGHSLGNDIDYFRKMNFEILKLPMVVGSFDTSTMWQYVTKSIQPRKLTAVLSELGLLTWNPHNAGNDAVYTLQAMMGIAIKALDSASLPVGWLNKTPVAASDFVTEASNVDMNRRERSSSDTSTGGVALTQPSNVPARPPTPNTINLWVNNTEQPWGLPNDVERADFRRSHMAVAPLYIRKETKPSAQPPSLADIMKTRPVRDPFRDGHYIPQQFTVSMDSTASQHYLGFEAQGPDSQLNPAAPHFSLNADVAAPVPSVTQQNTGGGSRQHIGEQIQQHAKEKIELHTAETIQQGTGAKTQSVEPSMLHTDANSKPKTAAELEAQRAIEYDILLKTLADQKLDDAMPTEYGGSPYLTP